jgi:hypothetical protein
MKRLFTPGLVILMGGILLLGLWHGGVSWATDLGIRRIEAHSTAMPPVFNPSAPWRAMRFFRDPDAYYWLSFTRDLRASGHFRVRRTMADNAPYGREVHWAQLPIWSLAALSIALERLGGLAPPIALELAGRMLMPLLGFMFFGVLLLLLARRLGAGISLLVVLPMAISSHFEFHTLRPDHHGFQIAFATGSLLCLLYSGLGWIRTAEGASDRRNSIPSMANARRWFIASGLLCGMALWMGATVFVFVLCAFAAGIALSILRTDKESIPDGVVIQPELFRWWGLAGAGASLFFYLVEYAPQHMSMRLEVNHPLYALCFLGSAECLRGLARWKQNRGRLPRQDRLPVAAGFLAAITLPVLVVFGPNAWYLPRTPLMLRLHTRLIAEFLSPLNPAVSSIYLHRLPLLLLGGIALGFTLRLLRRKDLPFPWRAPLRLLATASTVFFLLFCWQGRWLQFIPLFSFLLAGFCLAAMRDRIPDESARRRAAWLPAFLGIALLLQAGHAADVLYLRSIRDMLRVERMDGPLNLMMLQRNMMLSLKAAAQSVPMRLILPTDIAPAAYYFGVGDTVGALYWENLEGLTATAEFLGDPLPGPRAREIASERSISHVLSYNTPYDAHHCYYLLTGKEDLSGLSNTLGFALSEAGPDIPAWIQQDYRLLLAVSKSYSVFLPAETRWMPNKKSARIYSLHP